MTSAKQAPGKERPEMIVSVPRSPRRHHHMPCSPTSGAGRRIGIAVDLSDESAYAVRWAVQNYLRRGDAVVLLHVASSKALYGADWGSIDPTAAEESLEREMDVLTAGKAEELAQPLAEAGTPFKIHIVKDVDLKERLCLEVERLGLSAVIMGSRGFGLASRSSTNGARLGTVSDYCVRRCCCPVVVVRLPDVTISTQVFHHASDDQFAPLTNSSLQDLC